MSSFSVAIEDRQDLQVAGVRDCADAVRHHRGEFRGLMVPAASRLSQRYAELTLPIAVIAGDGDKVAFPDRHARRLHAEISHSELAIQPGVGHMAHYADQNAIMAAVNRLQAAA